MTPQHLREQDSPDLAALAGIARADAGLNLPSAKHPMMRARLRKRMTAIGCADLASYRALIEGPGGRDERLRMVRALTTHVSHFFREPHHFDILRTLVLPPLVARARQGARVRLWSAGAARGQEAHSMAMVLADLMPDAPRHDIRIFATDLDPAVIEDARLGLVPPDDLASLPAGHAGRFLRSTTMGWEVSPRIRGLVDFRVENLHQPWPARARFDAVFCRNVLIYFDIPGCEALLARLAAAIAPGGWLFLGHAERLSGPASHLFIQAGRTCFRRTGEGARQPRAVSE